MEFRILGPLEIVDDDDLPQSVGGSRERDLLALLLLSANQVVSTERLVDEFWEDGPPTDPIHALRVYASRLRKGLRTVGADDLLVTRPPGYLIRLPAGALDAERFNALAAAGRQQLAGGDPGRAAETLRQALSLWRGPALADVLAGPTARAEAARLEEARLAATEDRVEADMACGRHRELVADLEALCRAHPLRERLWSQRMLALYRSGRQAEALRTYQEARRIHVEELGVEPSGALTRLERAVLCQAHEIDWPTDGGQAPSPPLPAELAVEGSRPFVSRAEELAAAHVLLNDDTRDRLAVLWLLGEPGIGKTRLATEIARRFHSAGGAVLFGRCSEDLAVPYQPFIEALRWHVLHLPDAELAYRLGDAPGELIRLVPEIRDRIPDLEPSRSTSTEIDQHRLFEAVRTWLAGAGAGRPTVVVLDDLHWASRPTLALLGHVTSSPERSRTLLVCTARTTAPDDNQALASLVEMLERVGAPSTRVELRGLSVGDVGALVESAAGRTLDDHLRTVAGELHHETAGNPLFIDTLLDTFSPDTTWQPGEVSRTLAETVLRRVGRLPADVAKLLRVAAVVGLEFDLRVAASAARDDELTVLDAFETANRAGLLEETGVDRFRFSHALVRSALRNDLSRSRRVRVHVAVGEVIEALHAGNLDEHAATLAFHFSEGIPVSGPEKAYRYTVLQAERATRLLAHDEAVDAYRRAFGLLAREAAGPARDIRRLDLLIRLGEAQRLAGDPAHRATLLEAAQLAQRQGDVGALTRSALANRRPFLYSATGQVDRERVAILESALEAVGDADSAERARLLAQLGVELVFAGDRSRRVRLADDALALARRLGDHAVLAEVLLDRYATVFSPSTLSERLVDSAELMELAEERGDPLLMFRAAWIRYRTTLDAGRIEEAGHLLAVVEHLAAELGQPMLVWLAAVLSTGWAFLEGRMDEAERRLDETLELGKSVSPGEVGFGAGQRCILLAETGRLNEFTELLSEDLDPVSKAFDAVLALAHCQAERYGDARKIFARVAADGFATVPDDIAWLPTLAASSIVASHLADGVAADRLTDLLAPYADQVVASSAMPWGSVSRFLAIAANAAGRSEEASAWSELDAERRAEWARILGVMRRSAPNR